MDARYGDVGKEYEERVSIAWVDYPLPLLRKLLFERCGRYHGD